MPGCMLAGLLTCDARKVSVRSAFRFATNKPLVLEIAKNGEHGCISKRVVESIADLRNCTRANFPKNRHHVEFPITQSRVSHESFGQKLLSAFYYRVSRNVINGAISQLW